MAVRGIRGATTVDRNDRQSVLDATRKLLEEIAWRNAIAPEDIAAVFFTVTDDLDSIFPAQAARLLGWCHVPLLDAREVPVPGSLRKCIRVLLLWNTARAQAEIVHVYQRKARQLRPDLCRTSEDSEEEGHHDHCDA